MRCSVCGRDTRYHKRAVWALFKKIEGRWVQTSVQTEGSKCFAIRAYQSMFLAGMGELRKVKVY